MSHFAKIENNIVTNVIVAEQDFINSGSVGSPSDWVETCYEGSIRKRYAGIGYSYNKELDAFITPQPFPSWVLDTETTNWNAPVLMPQDGKSYVCETSAETLRHNVAETKSFIKWDGDQPEFVNTLETLEGHYTYTEILDILSTPEWTAPMEEV